jgi:hypothetical protein
MIIAQEACDTTGYLLSTPPPRYEWAILSGIVAF